MAVASDKSLDGDAMSLGAAAVGSGASCVGGMLSTSKGSSSVGGPLMYTPAVSRALLGDRSGDGCEKSMLNRKSAEGGRNKVVDDTMCKSKGEVAA